MTVFDKFDIDDGVDGDRQAPNLGGKDPGGKITAICGSTETCPLR